MGKGKRRGGGESDDGAAEHRPARRPPAPDEILRPVQAVVHRAHAVARRSLANLAAADGRGARAAARFPRAGAAVLVHPGAALRRRRHRLGARPADGRRRCDGVRPARARLRGARVRRRIFPPPRAALSAVAAGGAGGGAARVCAPRSCCSCASSAARRCRAGPTSCRRSSARCCGRCCPVLLQWPQRPQRSPAELDDVRTAQRR